jgi:osmotically-inducible protein OsmY
MHNLTKWLTPLLGIGLALTVTSCPGGATNPDTEKKIQEKVAVPGMAEELKATDEAVAAAIKISWAADPELAQEQLAVEDVHNGKVRITGIVSRKELKERAEGIAKHQEHVFDVVSTITVDESLKSKRINLDEM